MSDLAIRVGELGKLYKIGSQARYKTMRDKLTHMVHSPFLALRSAINGVGSGNGTGSSNNTFWALKDVSFEIKKGEVVGIIGRNGAGKTTLLKILSRITEPTRGSAEIYGRVGALLEVGTGFHPELTGRENVYLNGAILGMKRKEMDRQFEPIVSFAEVEKFLDTPVKRYSSGMAVRLAFAIAAHLQPEILLVDEVLAVGDAAFQKKCIGRMGEVAGAGRTVLFVSHNLGAVSQLCGRTVWLDGGRVKKIGVTHEVIHDYLASLASTTGTWTNSARSETTPEIKLSSAAILTAEGKRGPIVKFDENFSLEIDYEIRQYVESPWTIVFRVSNLSGVAVFTSWDIDSSNHDKPKQMGKYRALCKIPPKFLRPGVYSVSLGIYFTNSNMKMSDFQEHLFQFEISSVGYPMNADRGGVVTPVLSWSFESKND